MELIKRYTNQKMEKIWTDENKFSKFLEVELASIEAFSKLGVIPIEDYELIRDNARFDVDEINELEKTTKHDVIAFTRNISSYLGSEKKWFHYGLTSTDVVDSANSLLIKAANEEIVIDLKNFMEVIKEKANMYIKTPCIGRTHGMHAEVTSFGLKWALYYDELKRDLRRLELARKDIEVVKISGAVGNFSVVPPMVEEYVASILNLGYADISTQVLSRDRHANYIFAIAQIASTIEKIAIEVRHLSRSEVHEVEENFSDGQKGSSAMPHKRNPIASENMCGCARILRSYVNVALENNILWHERDISHSSAERIMLADATTLIDYMLVRYTSVIRDLVVFPRRMMENINLNFNIVFSGRVLSVLIDRGLSRDEAYDLIQTLTFRAYDEQIDFRKLLKTSKVRGILDEQEIDDCFNVDYYLRNVEYIYERVGVKNE